MKYYRDKKLLVVPFNMGNPNNSITYDQVWYCDSSWPTDLITSDQLICDWTDVMAVLNE
jgi:hypothetical protein